MKELSIEEKAKRYDEAIEELRGLLEGIHEEKCDIMEEDIIKIFPELKESEDEKIRKELIKVYDDIRVRYGGNTEWQEGITYDMILAWLEKQGESIKLSEEEQNRFAKGVLTRCALSFIDYLDAHKYESKMCVSNGECKDIENAFHNAMWDRLHRYYCKYIEKQGEQKPNYCHHEVDLSGCSEEYRKGYYDGWNNCNQQHAQLKAEQKPACGEEDEIKIKSIVAFLKSPSLCAMDGNKGIIDENIKYLKSLKDRYAWKPSDAQMASITCAVRKMKESACYDSELVSLFNDLKKLREE